MPRIAEVRERLTTVQGIRDVCGTLATVAAARLWRTRDRALGVRTLAARLRDVVARQQAAARAQGVDPATLSPLLAEREVVRRTLLLVIGADRGLCGGYNLALERATAEAIRATRDRGTDVDVRVLGEHARRFLARAGIESEEVDSWPRAGVTDDLIDGVLAGAVDAFESGAANEVWAAYTEFITPVEREPRLLRLAPIAPMPEIAPDFTWWFHDPNREECVNELLGMFVRLQVEDVLLESYASEQAARLVTMEEATERADRLLMSLRVGANRLRREAITGDLIGVLQSGRMRGEGDDEQT